MSKECPTCGISTPNMMFVLRQKFPDLTWQIVPVTEDQGRAMKERGEPHVYSTAEQAKIAKYNVTKEFIISCPFCSSSTDFTRIVGTSFRVDLEKHGYCVICTQCKMSGPVARSMKEAIELWNNRSLNRVET